MRALSSLQGIKVFIPIVVVTTVLGSRVHVYVGRSYYYYDRMATRALVTAHWDAFALGLQYYSVLWS